VTAVGVVNDNSDIADQDTVTRTVRTQCSVPDSLYHRSPDVDYHSDEILSVDRSRRKLTTLTIQSSRRPLMTRHEYSICIANPTSGPSVTLLCYANRILVNN